MKFSTEWKFAFLALLLVAALSALGFGLAAFLIGFAVMLGLFFNAMINDSSSFF